MPSAMDAFEDEFGSGKIISLEIGCETGMGIGGGGN